MDRSKSEETKNTQNPRQPQFAQLIIHPITPGLSCSKLTISLVNVSLKFQTLISQICGCQYFLLKKCEKASLIFFSTKNFSVFGYKVVKHLLS